MGWLEQLKAQERARGRYDAGRLGGVVEPIISIGSGAIAEPIAGWSGIASGGDVGAINAVRNALTYEPRSPQGQASMGALANALMSAKTTLVDENPPVNALANALRSGADYVGERSPLAGAMLFAAPAAAASLLSPGASVARNALTNAGKRVKTLTKLRGTSGGIGSTFSSRNVKLYDPKPLQQRSFHDDYPQGVAGPDGSRLALDIDGNPLTAKYIAGRRVGGGLDENVSGFGPKGIADELGIQSSARARSGAELKGDAGRFASNGGDRKIYVDQSLEPEVAGKVFSHELGHAIDDLTFGGGIPTTGLKKELSKIYEDLNTGGWFKPGRGMTPDGQGYSASATGREQMAEAIRAYLRDPNYIKTVAPKTAARIREYVNSNPNLNKTIQFNSAAGSAGLLGYEEE